MSENLSLNSEGFDLSDFKLDEDLAAYIDLAFGSNITELIDPENLTVDDLTAADKNVLNSDLFNLTSPNFLHSIILTRFNIYCN